MPGTITGAVTSPDSHIRASAGLRNAEPSFPAAGNKGLVAGALACAFLAFGAASQGVVAVFFFDCLSSLVLERQTETVAD